MWLKEGKGYEDEKCPERGVPGYAREAALTLDEFTAVVIHSILQLNNARILKSFERSRRMAEDGVEPFASSIWEWHERSGKSSLIFRPEEELQIAMLPIGTGKITRRGLEFQKLTYYCRGFNSRCANAGIDGAERVKVAYDMLNAQTVYLIERGRYVRFELTTAKERYKGCLTRKLRRIKERA